MSSKMSGFWNAWRPNPEGSRRGLAFPLPLQGKTHLLCVTQAEAGWSLG